jgi:hypothetical protein
MAGSFSPSIDLLDVNSGLEAYKANVNQGRLTLTSNTPVLSSNVTGATTIFYTPYTGNQISIWNGTQWGVRTFSELSLSLSGLTADTNYDVFIFDNSGTLTLEAIAWSDSGAGTSARAIPLAWLDGVRVKSTDNRKYLGSVRIGSSGINWRFNSTIPASLCLCNEFNKLTAYLICWEDFAGGYSYTTQTPRYLRNDANYGIEMISNKATAIVLYSVNGALIGFYLNGTHQPRIRGGSNTTGGSQGEVSLTVIENTPGFYNYVAVSELGQAASPIINNTSLRVVIEY